jgi:hypothetical protein
MARTDYSPPSQGRVIGSNHALPATGSCALKLTEFENRASGERGDTCTRDEVGVVIVFGHCAAESLCELQTGDLVSLDQRSDDPVDIIVDGRRVARGCLVELGGCVGARIVEVLDIDPFHAETTDKS